MKWDKPTLPRVTAMLLTADRQAYTERALASFLKQTYPHKSILVLDSGQQGFMLKPELLARFSEDARMRFVHVNRSASDTIGSLRNLAAELSDDADILMHWDSDDWSAPERMENQAFKLVDNPAIDCVGYETMYFYRRTDRTAWLYHNRGYCIGTSLAYWRDAWKAAGGFENRTIGEDNAFQKALRVVTFAGLRGDGTPLLVAEQHGGNTSRPGIVDSPASLEWTKGSSYTVGLLEERLGYQEAVARIRGERSAEGL